MKVLLPRVRVVHVPGRLAAPALGGPTAWPTAWPLLAHRTGLFSLSLGARRAASSMTSVVEYRPTGTPLAATAARVNNAFGETVPRRLLSGRHMPYIHDALAHDLFAISVTTQRAAWCRQGRDARGAGKADF